MQNVWVNWLKQSSPIMCFSRLSLFMCIAIFQRKMSVCVWVFFKPLSSVWALWDPKQWLYLKVLWEQVPLPCPPWGDSSWILQNICGGACMKKGGQSLMNHLSLAWGCVHTVNLYIDSLSLHLAGLGAFLVELFLSYLGSLIPWHKQSHQQNTRV